MDIKKLKEFILILDTYTQQGFIDAPPRDDFSKKVRQWLIDAGFATFIPESGKGFWISGYGHNLEVLGVLKSLLEEILGQTSEELWEEELGDG